MGPITVVGSPPSNGGGGLPGPGPTGTGANGDGYSGGPDGGVGGGGYSGGGGGSGGREIEYIDPAATLTPAPPPPDVTEYNCEQLRNRHLDDQIQTTGAGSLQDFINANSILSRNGIIAQRGYQSMGPGIYLSMGPNVRYITDPQNTDVVIDLRHMLVVGFRGPMVGNSIEVMQGLVGNISGFDHQDYFSNQLGYDFYRNYGDRINAEPFRFTEFLSDFLTNSSDGQGHLNRSHNTDPALINQRCP